MREEIQKWIEQRIRYEEIETYLQGKEDFISRAGIDELISTRETVDPSRILAIIDKAEAIETLTLEETALLLQVTDRELLERMDEAAWKIKHTVYDNRVVTFAPLYLSSKCVNGCRYCSFQSSNQQMERRVLPLEEIEREVHTLTGQIGHKRLIVVYGEHPDSGVEYMIDSVERIYRCSYRTKGGTSRIRRVNINAAPMQIGELKALKEVGIGTYQVFQETYHRPTYAEVHPPRTLKGDYLWRLYTMHRAFEAGIDDVGIGALFGLYDWRYEVLGLVAHTHELERTFGVGPHTISFPRLEPAANAPLSERSAYLLSDDQFRHAVRTLRLAVPYTGMILTAREDASIRREIMPLGITQTDASTRIGLGAYSRGEEQDTERQQFVIGDSRSLDKVVRELAGMGMITSFCTAGYRCGRTGKKIMDMLKCGFEGEFCKLNAILTFREWLDDFASEETRRIGEELIARELDEVRQNNPKMYPQLMEYYGRTLEGVRDLYF